MTEEQIIDTLADGKFLIHLFKNNFISKNIIRNAVRRTLGLELRPYREVTTERMVSFLKSRGTVKYWQIGRKFRSEFESILRPLIDSGQVIEKRENRRAKGRHGMLYTWVESSN